MTFLTEFYCKFHQYGLAIFYHVKQCFKYFQWQYISDFCWTLYIQKKKLFAIIVAANLLKIMHKVESCIILFFVSKGQSKRWDIQLDISAPRFLVPESFQDRKASVVSVKILSRVNRIDYIILVNLSVSLKVSKDINQAGAIC